MRRQAAAQLARSLTPPAAVAAAGRLRRVLDRSDGPPEWEHVDGGWAAGGALAGWNVRDVAAAYREKLPAFRAAIDGTQPLAVPTSALFPSAQPSLWEQNVVLAFAYALLLACRQSDRVSILDWGGGVGLFYLLSGALLPDEVELEYHCKELPRVCEEGRELLPEVVFHDDESCLDRRYDLVCASSSLQYSEDWSGVLSRLSASAGRYLYLTRVPVVTDSPSHVVRQHAGGYGLETEFVSWVFRRDELVECAEAAGMELVREFLVGSRAATGGTPGDEEKRGFLFRPGARPAAQRVDRFGSSASRRPSA